MQSNQAFIELTHPTIQVFNRIFSLYFNLIKSNTGGHITCIHYNTQYNILLLRMKNKK